jgi:oxygen-independent coproporphyrinogen-3 oxidase
LIGLGITSIGTVGRSFAQNVKELEDYYTRIDNNQLAVFRGVEIDDDDIIRRDVIMQLICHFHLDINTCETRNNINFNQYFADELIQLQTLAADGLITLQTNHIHVTDAGRLLIRNICMVFDRYIKNLEQKRFSRAI